MYAEDTRVDGTGVLRYSVIFSNEDGGTATPALLARWGRTTDIEMAYEEEWRGGKMVSARTRRRITTSSNTPALARASIRRWLMPRSITSSSIGGARQCA